jgi:hypothetical protein
MALRLKGPDGNIAQPAIERARFGMGEDDQHFHDQHQ